MKATPSLLVSGLSCVLAGVCLFQVHGLRTELSTLRSQNAAYYSQLQDGIGNISSTVSNQLEQQQNLLAQSDYHYGAVNAESGTVVLHYSMLPKEYTPGVTQAEFHINGAAWPMAYESGRFAAEAELPLFDESSDAYITLQDGGTLRTQALKDYFAPQYDVLSDIYVNPCGSTTFTRDAESSSLQVQEEQPIVISFSQSSDVMPEIKSIALTAELNGREIDRIAVALDAEGQAAVRADAAWNAIGIPESSAYYALLNKTYTVPAGQCLRIFADVELGNGLLCRMLVDSVSADSTGNAMDDSYDETAQNWGQPRYVYYAPTHKLLWDSVLGAV